MVKPNYIERVKKRLQASIYIEEREKDRNITHVRLISLSKIKYEYFPRGLTHLSTALTQARLTMEFL